MYAMISPRSDLSYVVSVVSKYMANLVKNIGRQFSGYSGTFMILLMFVCILGGQDMMLLGTLTSILLKILIKEDLLLGMCSLLELVLSVGKPFYGLQLRCRLPRHNIWLLQKLVRRLFD